jgi:hypothetical protein
MRIAFIILLSLGSLNAKKIDVVSNFTLDELVPRNKMVKDTGSQIRYFRYTFDLYYNNFFRPDIDKVLFMGDVGDEIALSKIPIEKRIMYRWEAPGGHGNLDYLFSRIYTFNDDVIDGIKYFKFYYPVLMPTISDPPAFKDKKFCVMITHRCTEERVNVLKFFESKPSEEFEYYGFEAIVPTPLYRGQIPGHPVCNEKLEMLKKFRFCACFENTAVNGYITEKIFTCFAAACVPIYWGAPNVDQYIPKDCFIALQDFVSYEELYQYLKSITDGEYQTYLENISTYLNSEKAQLFSKENFNKTVQETLTENLEKDPCWHVCRESTRKISTASE